MKIIRYLKFLSIILIFSSLKFSRKYYLIYFNRFKYIKLFVFFIKLKIIPSYLQYAVTNSTQPIQYIKELLFKINETNNFNSSDPLITPIPNFHWSPPLNFKIDTNLSLKPHINLILPSLLRQHMSGGPNTALILIAKLTESGELVRIICSDADANGREKEIFIHMRQLLGKTIRHDLIQLVDGFDRQKEIKIGINDIFMATAWWTAQIVNYALPLIKSEKFLYLIQDFEPILHEGSTFHARALETYSLPHIPIINTSILKDHFIEGKIGNFRNYKFAKDALFFEPAISREFYYPSKPTENNFNKKKVLLFYARPTSGKRNLFEIGVESLRNIVKSELISHDSWEIFAIGENINRVYLGNNIYLNPLPWKDYKDYASTIRNSDLLLSLMLAPHPSYPPLEMAACGKMVVTNSYSVKTSERLQSLSKNILVAEPSINSVTYRIKEALRRINSGLGSYDASGHIDYPKNWNESLDSLMPVISKKIKEIREESSSKKTSFVPGLPIVPKNPYENFRLQRLALRRKNLSKFSRNKNSLLSFITSAFNTNSEYLEDLANSLINQDDGMPFEWIILDNGSTDLKTIQTLNRIAKFNNVKLLRVKNNLGIVGGMRFLLENASGKYILPLDSDDIIEPDCVNVISSYIIDHNFPPLIYTDEDKLFNKENFIDPYFKPDWDPVLFIHSCYIAHLCVIDRELALSLNLYTRKSAEGCHDWDSFISFMLAGYTPHHIPEVLYSWRIHSKSTSGNIKSKSYIESSHKKTLQRIIEKKSNIKLQHSPYFKNNVDWCYKQINKIPKIETLKLKTNNLKSIYNLDEVIGKIEKTNAEFVHFISDEILTDEINTQWKNLAFALFSIFDDIAVMGGFITNQDDIIVDGPSIFGFGSENTSPYIGKSFKEAGYFAINYKPHSVSAVPIHNCLMRVSFLKNLMPTLKKARFSLDILHLYIGAFAAENKNRVVCAPFFKCNINSIKKIPSYNMDEYGFFVSKFWSLFPDRRFYSPLLDLKEGNGFQFDDDLSSTNRDLDKLRKFLPSYNYYLNENIKSRALSYPINKNISISLLTTVYEGSSLKYLKKLSQSIFNQTYKPEWIIVAHGNLPKKLNYFLKNNLLNNGAKIIWEKKSLGIMRAMRIALDNSTGDYFIPVDSDDLLTEDAIQIISCEALRRKYPEMLYSDEDLLINEIPASPFFRSNFDPILNLESSYIWHLVAIKRNQKCFSKLYTNLKGTWCHDYDTIMQIDAHKGRIEHIPEILYHWRQHDKSTTNNKVGDKRSLNSVRSVLNMYIKRNNIKNYRVETWPFNRGFEELYIKRNSKELPQFISIDTLLTNPKLNYAEDTILIISDPTLVINKDVVYQEVVRLFGLHENLGAIGGVAINKNGIIIDSCFLEKDKNLHSPWINMTSDYNGPYALWKKPQTVLSTGRLLGFFRLKFSQEIINKLTKNNLRKTNIDLIGLCLKLNKYGYKIAFSPIVRGDCLKEKAEPANSLHLIKLPRKKFNKNISNILLRYKNVPWT